MRGHTRGLVPQIGLSRMNKYAILSRHNARLVFSGEPPRIHLRHRPIIQPIMRFLARLIFIFIAGFGNFDSVGATESVSEQNATALSRLEELERVHAQLIDRLKKTVEAMPDGPERERAQELIKGSERASDQWRDKRYFHDGMPASAPMRAYYERVVKKIEDCGTRNFPSRDGKSIYGKGVMAITLDRNGQAMATTIEKSSGDALLDAQVGRIVSASSPFGALPNKIAATDARPLEILVIVTGFSFQNRGTHAPLKQSEQCRALVDKQDGATSLD